MKKKVFLLFSAFTVLPLLCNSLAILLLLGLAGAAKPFLAMAPQIGSAIGATLILLVLPILSAVVVFVVGWLLMRKWLFNRPQPATVAPSLPLDKIATDLIHDLRHPIQNLQNSLRVLDKAAADPLLLATIQKNVDRELTKINKFLYNLDHFTTERPILPIKTDLHTLIADAVDSLASGASNKNIVLTFNPHPSPVYVLGDPFALERLLSNLLTNAIESIEALPANSLHAREVAVSTDVENDTAILKVSDTGIGIEPERLATLFESLSTTKAKGLGLGLAITNKIIVAHKGRIEVESELGNGSTFTVYLPFFTASRR